MWASGRAFGGARRREGQGCPFVRARVLALQSPMLSPDHRPRWSPGCLQGSLSRQGSHASSASFVSAISRPASMASGLHRLGSIPTTSAGGAGSMGGAGGGSAQDLARAPSMGGGVAEGRARQGPVVSPAPGVMLRSPSAASLLGGQQDATTSRAAGRADTLPVTDNAQRAGAADGQASLPGGAKQQQRAAFWSQFQPQGLGAGRAAAAGPATACDTLSVPETMGTRWSED